MLPLILDRAGFAIFQNILIWCWQITIVAGMAILVLRWIGGARAAVQHAAWTAILVLLPFLPAMGWLAATAGTPHIGIPVLPYYVPPTLQYSAPAMERDTIDSGGEQPAEPSIVYGAPRHAHPWRMLAILYLTGAGACACMALDGRRRVKRWIAAGTPVNDGEAREAFRWAHERLSISGPVELVRHHDIPAPVTVGVMRPMVLVPSGFLDTLSAEELRAFALHELAHVKRRDPLVLAVATVIRFTLFFHPLVWYIARKTAELAEFSCDDMVLAHGADPSVYAEMLARSARILMGRPCSVRLAAGLHASRRPLSARVNAVLTGGGNCQRGLPRRFAGLMAVCTVTAVAAAVAFPLIQRDPTEFLEARSALMCGRDERVLGLLDINPWLAGVRDHDGRTLLHLAAGYNRAAVLQPLLDLKPDIHALDNKELTPLHVAVEHADFSVVKLLVEMGSDVNAFDHLQRTPLHIAAECGREDIAEYLVWHGAREDIFTACAMERCTLLETLIDENPSVVRAVDRSGMTPLHLAVVAGNTSITGRLLCAGADVNAVNTEGETPLHLAVWRGKTETARLLVEHGSEVNVPNRYGLTPLAVAEQRCRKELTAMLLGHGAGLAPADIPVREAWKTFRDAPYSSRAFMANMIAGGHSLRMHGCWRITNVYRAGRNGAGPLMVVKVRDGAKDRNTVFIFDDAGQLLDTLDGERVKSWKHDPHFNIDTSSIELLG